MDENLDTGGLTWQDYRAIVFRRRWSLMGPFFLCGLVAVGLAHLWPRLYRSGALVLVEQQKVPIQYVTPNVTSDLQDRLQAMTQQILSRTRLTRLIEQFNLYSRERQHMIMDDVVDKMRSEVRIEPVVATSRQGELTAFSISFAAENPRVAQQITSQLTSAFIDENLQARTEASEGTTQFLENQLEEARKDLQDKETRQREYKMRYLGELPEQEQSNLQILSSLEAQLHATADALSRGEQQKVYLESVRAEYVASQQKGVATGEATPNTPGPTIATADAALRSLKDQLTQLEAKYTPKHPDVISVKKQIAEWEGLERRLESEDSSQAKGKSEPATEASNEPAALYEIDARLKTNSMELNGYKKDLADLRQRINEMQSRLSLTPVREQQLAEVTRGYENARAYFQSLLTKKLESELATNLEKRQQGEQFRILDPASLPQRPSEPNQLLIISVGWLLGIFIGIGLAALMEVTHQTISTERDVSAFMQLPILVRIPTLRSKAEAVRRSWFRVLETAGVALLLAVSIGSGVYTYLGS